ncbi:MAG: hypothetical protein J7639_04910 [Paenibacillaceae bacterium]|nr:hypothetical protein [Paenibacillaceae bacterium]
MNKRVAAIITEYWDISHADVIVSKMLEGFSLNGRRYKSTLDIVSMYVDRFPDNDMSRGMAAKHGVPMYGTIREALLAGGDAFELDGIILIGEHGVYPFNEIGQELYPRRLFFEKCLDVMLEFDRIVPVYTDKGFAVVQEDIEWMYGQIKTRAIPFMSSSVVPFARRQPIERPFPHGAPLHRMFGFTYGSLERYVYHGLEMLQSVAEQRACGESGIAAVQAFKGGDAVRRLLSDEWNGMYRALGGFINLRDVDAYPYELQEPVFFELDYVDGLRGGLLYCDPSSANPEVTTFASAYQVLPNEEPVCVEFWIQNQKPYSHFGTLTLEIEKFIHTGRPPFPVERSLLTTGGLDACMRSHHTGGKIETPHLRVRY